MKISIPFDLVIALSPKMNNYHNNPRKKKKQLKKEFNKLLIETVLEWTKNLENE